MPGDCVSQGSIVPADPKRPPSYQNPVNTSLKSLLLLIRALSYHFPWCFINLSAFPSKENTTAFPPRTPPSVSISGSDRQMGSQDGDRASYHNFGGTFLTDTGNLWCPYAI